MGLTRVAITRPVFILMVISAMVILGLVSFTRLNAELFPNISFPVVTVVTTYSGASPDDVDRLVTQPLQDAIAGIANVDVLQSSSTEGRSQITITFLDSTDVDTAAIDVQRRVVEAGRLGRKTSAGYYDYGTDGSPAAPWVDLARPGGDLEPVTIQGRILAVIVNEAASALSDGVASAGDIDTATLGPLLDRLFGALPAKAQLRPLPAPAGKGGCEVIAMQIPQAIVGFAAVTPSLTWKQRRAGQILQAMEISLSSKPGAYSRYGSSVHKQVYVYGRLSLEPLVLTGAYGLAWGVGGFLLTPFLQKIGPAEAQKLRERVAAELKTTFASHYTKTISLREALDPDMIRTYNRKATGEKYLINPSL